MTRRRASHCSQCRHHYPSAAILCARGHQPRHYIHESDPHATGYRRVCADFSVVPIHLLRVQADLRKLATDMDAVATRMKYHGGFGELGDKGRQLAQSASIVRDWIAHIIGED